MSRSRLGVPGFVIVASAIYVPRVWLVGSPLYTAILSPGRLLVLGSVAKLLCLLVATLSSARVARALEIGNPSRRAWALLALGLAGFSLGQIGLMTYQLVLAREAPLPSIGDAGFLTGYLLMIVALGGFVRAYLASGMPVGRPRDHMTVAAVTTLVLTLAGVLLLRPVVAADVPAAERALNIAYPVLDFLALLPCVVLVRMAWALRGGRIAAVWTSLLTGFGFMAVGDVLFSYVSSMHAKALDPLVDLTLLLGYFFTAWGAVRQRDLAS